ncbi:MAG: GNAT family N-acetyltransferase [Jatrophihabitantaceae bacterium]
MLGNPNDDNFPKRVQRRRRDWHAERTWGARAGGRWVATLASEARTVTVPGCDGRTRDVSADALTAVTVSATHRRRGLLTQMLSASLAAARERGDAFSVLVAAEWPIYGRFGYAPAVCSADYTYLSRHPSAKVTPARAGAVRQVDPAELGALAPGVFDAARRLRAGNVDRPGLWWPSRLGVDGFAAIHEGKAPAYYLHDGADGPDGLLAWAVTRDFELDGSLAAIEVRELVAASDEAYRDLWAFLGGIDVVSEIGLHGRPVDEPVRWLLPDGRALRQTYAGDHTWLRLLDVPAALTARGYAVPGRLVLEVVDDDLGGYGAGRFRLDADAEGAQCRATSAGADLRLTQRALASVYLGGHTLRGQRLSASVAELTPGALGLADAMFATPLAPWNATGF